jgi:hypothetical protein
MEDIIEYLEYVADELELDTTEGKELVGAGLNFIQNRYNAAQLQTYLQQYTSLLDHEINMFIEEIKKIAADPTVINKSRETMSASGPTTSNNATTYPTQSSPVSFAQKISAPQSTVASTIQVASPQTPPPNPIQKAYAKDPYREPLDE